MTQFFGLVSLNFCYFNWNWINGEYLSFKDLEFEIFAQNGDNIFRNSYRNATDRIPLS